MELIRGLHNLRPGHRPSAVTVGNFDGVHRGHQAVIEQLRRRARRLALPAALVCFEPTPREFFAPDAAPARLTRLREKLELLAETGLDRVLVLRFDARLAALAPEDFVRQVLVEGLGARHVLVGRDFRFGHERRGDLDLLSELGARYGFSVKAAPTHRQAGARVSSSRIRAALAAGNLAEAACLLGRDYAIAGRVVHGEKLGRRLGFPTVNIPLARRVAPLTGVFVVRVEGAGPVPVHGVASIGTRPTVDGRELLLEAHLFEYDAELYGRYLRVALLHKLREEARFADLDELRGWIARDAEHARAWLQQHVL